ncbi:MAG TPA: hypothetical protein VM537_33800 [Anaerolineae bacterium]|nr:hypothetical protein [Anaerolineae bacterium]
MSNDEMAKAIQRATGSLPWDECTEGARMCFREVAQAVHDFLGAEKSLQNDAVAKLVAALRGLLQAIDYAKEAGRSKTSRKAFAFIDLVSIEQDKAKAALRAAGEEVGAEEVTA